MRWRSYSIYVRRYIRIYTSSFWRTWLKIHVSDMRQNLIKCDQRVTTLETWGAAWGIRLLAELSSCTSFAASQHFATWCQETALELKLVKQNICQMLPPLLSRQHEDLWPRTWQTFLKHAEVTLFCQRKTMWQEGSKREPSGIFWNRTRKTVKDWNSERDRAYPTSSKKSTKFHRFDPGLELSSLQSFSDFSCRTFC